MSTDYAEKEREFLASLESDTGRSLAEWMEAIAAQRFADKNEAIDWLRSQGFMFSKASWLERIHENGGRPIYALDAAPDTPEGTATGGAKLESTPRAPAPARGGAQPAQQHAARAEAVFDGPEPPAALTAAAPALAEDLDVLLVKAKALQPLARHLLREIAKAVSGVSFSAEAAHVSMRKDQEFGVLTIGPRELKLALALGGTAHAAPFGPARPTAGGPRFGPQITHMAVLSDARQVNAALLGAIVKAASEAQSHTS